MKRILSHTVVALAAGLCLRLFFVLKYPANSGDTVLYEQMASNWLQHHVYAPVDLRMPGYPAFLAAIYALTGRTGEAARPLLMFAQALIDLVSCVLIAVLAAMLNLMVSERSAWQRVCIAAIWLAALCLFTSNYVAVTLTESLAIFFTVAALLPLSLQVGRVRNNGWLFVKKGWRWANDYRWLATIGALLVGMGTLFRPEAPLILIACWIVLGVVLIAQRETLRWIRTVLYRATTKEGRAV